MLPRIGNSGLLVLSHTLADILDPKGSWNRRRLFQELRYAGVLPSGTCCCPPWLADTTGEKSQESTPAKSLLHCAMSR